MLKSERSEAILERGRELTVSRQGESPCEYETQFDSCFQPSPVVGSGGGRGGGGRSGGPSPPQKRGCSQGRATDPTSCRIQPLILPITNSTTLSLLARFGLAIIPATFSLLQLRRRPNLSPPHSCAPLLHVCYRQPNLRTRTTLRSMFTLLRAEISRGTSFSRRGRGR